MKTAAAPTPSTPATTSTAPAAPSGAAPAQEQPFTLARAVAGGHWYNDSTLRCECDTRMMLFPGSKIVEIGPQAHAHHVAIETEKALRAEIDAAALALYHSMYPKASVAG